MTTYKGIDYGRGNTNRDPETGIRVGVIPQMDVMQAWSDSSEPVYSYHCPHCGTYLKKGSDAKRCPNCYKKLDPDEFWVIEPDYYKLDDGEYIVESDSYGDLFILKSPYYTYAQFCSPCAPGACHLENPLDTPDENNKCYCLGHDWFEDGKAPYKVYDVKTNEEVLPK